MYTTDMQHVSTWLGEEPVSYWKGSLYFVLELINCKVPVNRGTVFSPVGHSCQRDQGEVTGEAGTQAAHEHRAEPKKSWNDTSQHGCASPVEQSCVKSTRQMPIPFMYQKETYLFWLYWKQCFPKHGSPANLSLYKGIYAKRKELENNPALSL